MTNMQRMENDLATADRREMVDRTVMDNRNKNDGLTWERRTKADRKETASQTTKNNRNKNDELTRDKRDKTDKTLNEHRLRNDKLTFHRREVKDGKLSMVLAVSLLALTVVAAFLIGSFFVLI